MSEVNDEEEGEDDGSGEVCFVVFCILYDYFLFFVLSFY